MTRISISYKKVTLTEISHACEDNEEYIKEENFDLESHDSQVRADERKKFAEWLKNNHFHIVEWKPKEKYSVNRSIKTVLAKYEKEQKNESN